jgi:MacB-like periplasmic core domain
MDIQVVRGRGFDDRDTANAPPVVVIGQSLAARLWPGQDPIGKRMRTYGAPGDSTNAQWQSVVGVVDDARCTTSWRVSWVTRVPRYRH